MQNQELAPSTLAELVALAESDNNRLAVRYEPAFPLDQQTINKCKSANHCNEATAIILCRMSFGKYQMMAYNLYLYRYEKCVFEFVDSDNDQLSQFLNFIAARNINYTLDEILHDTPKMNNFAKHYNGNAQQYSAHLLETYKNAGGVL